MKQTFLPCFFLFITLLISCQDESPIETGKKDMRIVMDQMEWLVGNWENDSEAGKTIEHWKRSNDSTYIGYSHLIEGEDTLWTETIELIQRLNKITYNPKDPEQNNGQPVPFTLIASTDSSMSFENPAHDFPQTISYKLIHHDSLYAEISGKHQGKLKSIPFPFKRKQNLP